MANELSALVAAAGAAVDRLTLTPAQSLQAAIARRTFSAIGVAATPTRITHDAVSGAVYSAMRAAASGTTSRAATAVRSAGRGRDVRPLSRSRLGRLALGAVNAVAGDHLDEQASDLAIAMSLRHAGADVACDAAELRRAFPAATTHVAIFLHGLAETEEWWLRGSRRRDGAARAPFGTRLGHDLGITPLCVRYNTGLHVSENGRRLAALLESLVAAWPLPVGDIALIGHSMGGLVARSACHQGAAAGNRWPSRVRRLVTLGTPHNGAPLAKAAHAVLWALASIPEAHPAAQVFATSAGISDLRFGSLTEADWRDAPGSRPFEDRRAPVPLLRGCTHTFITATVTRRQSHPLGRLAGDLLVRMESAGGRCGDRSIPIDPASVIHVGGLTHFDLLDHPVVYDHLRRAFDDVPLAQA